MSPVVYSPEDIRRILLEHQLLFTAHETCAKWDIRPGTLARWKRDQRPWRKPYGFRELLIVVLFRSGGTPSEMIPYLDYLNHAVYTEEEIVQGLQRLEEEGIAVRDGNAWRYNRARLQGARPFIF